MSFTSPRHFSILWLVGTSPPGDFVQAYVIGHEVAHPVQNLLKLNEKFEQVQQGGETEINQQSVWLELPADYLAGGWAHHTQNEFDILEDGDISEAIQAAHQIGDDTLQMESQGYNIPEPYTHGTSVQRVLWFHAGMSSGNLNDCLRLAKLPYGEL